MKSRTDTVIVSLAMCLSVIGLLALAGVVFVGVSGQSPSAVLTWIGMLTIPAAFVLLLVEFARGIARRRSA